MATQATLAQKQMDSGNYASAINNLTLALATSQSPVWLTKRSVCYQRTGKHDLALADADAAYHTGKARGKRDLMATAQFRRALALHGLKRYGDARMCLTWASKLNEKETGLTIWMAKVKVDYEKATKEAGEDGDMCKVTVQEVPAEAKTSAPVKEATPVDKETPKTAPATPAAATPLQATPKEKIRNEWYQSNQSVMITIFAKGVPKEKAEVVIKEGSLEISFPTTDTDAYDYTVSPLFAKIDPSTSSFRITPHKIEITLQKSAAGLKWAALEGTEPIESSSPISTALPINAFVTEQKPPVYPTSSRTGPKNWDNLVSDDDVNEEAATADDFFQQLYAGADDDTKRAMMKSYQESNGTALSTDWSAVSKETVKTVPPEGVVAKKWGE